MLSSHYLRVRTRAALAVAIGLAALAQAGTASAWCLTATCGAVMGHQCVPAQPDDCGIVLFWPSPCPGWSLQQDASSQIAFAEAELLVQQAFATWTDAACPGGGSPALAPVELAPAVCDHAEYNIAASNANAIIFRDDAWPYPFNTELALTTLTFKTDTGAILDADVEIDSARFTFSTGDVNVTYDLASILAHELGHFLGMDHSPDTDATMFASYGVGEIQMRDLSADDVAGMCAAYPPGPIDPGCDPAPSNGFSALCGADQNSGGAGGGGSGGGAPGGGAPGGGGSGGGSGGGAPGGGAPGGAGSGGGAPSAGPTGGAPPAVSGNAVPLADDDGCACGVVGSRAGGVGEESAAMLGGLMAAAALRIRGRRRTR